MKYAICIVGFVCLTIPAVALSIAAPPPPPLGWEESIAPGFDPPIEETIVRYYHADDETRQTHAEAWGPGAKRVLTKLRENDAWRDYHEIIDHYLALIDGFENVSKNIERLRSFCEKCVRGEHLDGADWRILNALVESATTETRAVALEFFGNAEPEAQPKIIDIVSRFAGEEPLDYLKKMLDLARDPSARESISAMIRDSESTLRATEPMSVILNKEAGGGDDQ